MASSLAAAPQQGSPHSQPNSTPAHVKEADQAVLQALINEGLNASEPRRVNSQGGGVEGGTRVGGGVGGEGKTAASFGNLQAARGEGAGVIDSHSQLQHDSDIKRFHALLKVLVQACILALIPPDYLVGSSTSSTVSQGASYANRITTAHLTPAHIAQAKNTLAILQRNTAVRPDVLLSSGSGVAGDVIAGLRLGADFDQDIAESATTSAITQRSYRKQPLYKWILPRFIHTSSILRLMIAPQSDSEQPRRSPRKDPSSMAVSPTHDQYLKEIADIADLIDGCCTEIIRTVGTRMGDQADGEGQVDSMSLKGLTLVRDAIRDMVSFVKEINVSMAQESDLPFIMFPIGHVGSRSSTNPLDSAMPYPLPPHLPRTVKASLSLTTSRAILQSSRSASSPSRSADNKPAVDLQTPSWTTFSGDSFAKSVLSIGEIVTQLNAEVQAASALSLTSDAATEGDAQSVTVKQRADLNAVRYNDFVTGRIALRCIALHGLNAVFQNHSNFMESVVLRASTILTSIISSRLRSPTSDKNTSRTVFRAESNRVLADESSLLVIGLTGIRQSRAGRMGGGFWLALRAGLTWTDPEVTWGGLGGVDRERSADCSEFLLAAIAALLLPSGACVEYLARSIPLATLEACASIVADDVGSGLAEEIRSMLDDVTKAKMSNIHSTGRGMKRKRLGSLSQRFAAGWKASDTSGATLLDQRLGVEPLGKASGTAGTLHGCEVGSSHAIDTSDPDRYLETLGEWKARLWIPSLEELGKLTISWRAPADNTAATLLWTSKDAELSKMRSLGSSNIADMIMQHMIDLTQEPGFLTLDLVHHRQWMTALCAVARYLCDSSAKSPKPTEKVFTQRALTAWSLSAQPLVASRKDASAADLSPCFATLKLICSFGTLEGMLLNPRRNGPALEWLTWGLAARHRSIRILACQIVIELHRVHALHHSEAEASRKLDAVLTAMDITSEDGPPHCRETIYSAYGEIAKNAQGAVLGRVVRKLILALGSPVNAIRGIAFVHLHAAARAQSKTVFGMVSPYLPTLSVEIMNLSQEQLNEVVQILGFSRAAFAQSNAIYILPALVISKNRASLDNVAKIVDKHLGRMLVDHVHNILAEIYKLPRDNDAARASSFLSRVLLDMTSSGGQREVPMANLITSCILPLLVDIVVDFGDAETSPGAEKALRRIQACITPAQSKTNMDVGTFLRPHMLGIISAMHERLHDLQVKTSSSVKIKILRSLVGLIQRIGSTIATYAPQIMASFQATLAAPDLRTEALLLCQIFTESLKFSDVGPNAASIIVALVAVWTELSPEQIAIAKRIIDYILVENIDHMKDFLDEIVSLDGIPEVRLAAQRLEGSRPRSDLRLSLNNIIRRCSNDNTLVATRSLMELDALLKRNQRGIQQLAHGEKFDPAIITTSRVLMAASARDGEVSRDLRRAAYNCIGTLGALDPDRLQLRTEENMVIQSGFGDPDEAIDFAMHLIQKVLVVAFRTTTNTKHQAHLGFAIQELLKFCGFNPKLLNLNAGVGGSFSNKVRLRWAQIQKQPQLYETIWPFLEGKFSVVEVPPKLVAHPIYTTSATYREWIQRWTADLIARVLLIEDITDPIKERSRRAVLDAKAIFSVFRGVIRNEDVGVAHHILPHLVLYVLVFAENDATSEIIQEVVAVLQDQVSPNGHFSPDRRSLSAQAIFDLLDYLSHWLSDQKLQLAQIARKRKDTRNTRLDSHYVMMEAQAIRVSRFLTVSIDNELVAAAALKSRAYARSLRNFEERISHLQRQQHKADDELQAYYENLHELYSALDEPDGMEGISTRVIAPNLDHQIREHETVGRWASAQSCWELCLQRAPDDLNYHLGLLRCLRNVGHYDTLRTHIRGVLSFHPEWRDALAAYQVESAWTLGDWAEVAATVNTATPGPEISIGRVLLAMQQRDKDAFPRMLADAREHIGTLVSADHRQYGRAYPAVVQLHILAEVEMVYNASQAMDRHAGVNRKAFSKQEHKTLTANFDSRLTSSLPAFKHQESILSARRAVFGLLYVHRPTQITRYGRLMKRVVPCSQPAHGELREEATLAWISSAKIARKAGYEQTAYSAILQASDSQAAFAFLQHAKLLKDTGQLTKALTELENGIRPLRREAPLGQVGHAVDLTDDDGQSAHNREVAKAVMLQARWAAEAGRYDHNNIVKLYREAMVLAPQAESPHYRLGHYYDTLSAEEQRGTKQQDLHLLTCKSYVMALTQGTKYIYQTMPRLLTLWLDIAEQGAEKPEKASKAKQGPPAADSILVSDLEKLVTRARKHVPAFAWYTAFPQIVSRIDHVNTQTRETLSKITSVIMLCYPRQAVWALMGAYSSNGSKGERHDRVKDVFNRVINQEKTNNSGNKMASNVIVDAVKLCPMLLELSEDAGLDPTWPNKATKDQKGPNQNKFTLTLTEAFPYAKKFFPSKMILPLQDALTCTLPASNVLSPNHDAFPNGFVSIKGLDERVDIMPSLQRPKKLCFLGDDGRRYNFLVKPHDDLRKDARLMDFNSLINKLLVSSSESRRRNLYIRTYAVMPLNEECGLLEWVANTVAFRSILTRLYDAQRGTKIFTNEVMAWLEEARRAGPAACGETFTKKILPVYQPAVFHQWFFESWPEPTAWFASRLAYARTLAVMSMVGFVLGLGDRHGENILFDSTTGDTVHVDFNCLFEKGRTFDVSEKVPFRLTLNLVDGLGTTGVEGVYRKAAENTLAVLRANRDSLTSVLESFVHDPLVEWEQATKRDERHKGKKGAADLRTHADRALQPIKQKLRGIGSGDPSTRTGDRGRELSVQNQADALIKEATSPINLGGMYVGWAAWL